MSMAECLTVDLCNSYRSACSRLGSMLASILGPTSFALIHLDWRNKLAAILTTLCLNDRYTQAMTLLILRVLECRSLELIKRRMDSQIEVVND